jgi:hypothetical protein
MTQAETSHVDSQSPKKTRRHTGKIVLGMFVIAVFLLLFVVPPSSWLIPSEPLVRGSSGMMVLSFPEIEPRWRWLQLRGSIAVPALKDAMLGGTAYSRERSIAILAERKDSALIPDFENAVYKGGDVQVLCNAIADTGGPNALPALQRIAANHSMTIPAVRAMGRLRNNVGK